jgi:prevent-host-death family protein
MSIVSIAEAKDSLPALVSAAQSGETVTITRHGRPVAQISAAVAPTCTPRSIDWIEAQLAALPVPSTDPAAVLRALRDDE